jgi:hypothetical protein
MIVLAFRLGRLALVVGLVVAGLMLFSSLPQERLLGGYILFVGGLILLGLVEVTRGGAGPRRLSPYERALERRRPIAARPPDLARLEREVELAAAGSFDLHFRLRPALREVAAHRLASRYGVELDSGSPEVRAALGEELWEIVRPDRRPPVDRGFGPGLALPRLRAALDTLERI